ncbi:MAG TPA: chorismate-binding protein, partial [Pirellulales bacterium]
MTVERYSHVMHITSNVTGQLSPGCDAFDALRACLPAGTVSGAPKVRAMQIIDELEPHRRGPYAGAVGYFDFNGNMDTCIALRTIVIQDGIAYVQAGAGLVADSIPAAEYQETLNKARGLLTAVELTERRTRQNRGPTPRPPAANPSAPPAATPPARTGGSSRSLASLPWLAIGLGAGLLASVILLATLALYFNSGPKLSNAARFDPATNTYR